MTGTQGHALRPEKFWEREAFSYMMDLGPGSRHECSQFYARGPNCVRFYGEKQRGFWWSSLPYSPRPGQSYLAGGAIAVLGARGNDRL